MKLKNFEILFSRFFFAEGAAFDDASLSIDADELEEHVLLLQHQTLLLLLLLQHHRPKHLRHAVDLTVKVSKLKGGNRQYLFLTINWAQFVVIFHPNYSPAILNPQYLDFLPYGPLLPIIT